jgi:tetratricopeptide (TPR) repeat protein
MAERETFLKNSPEADQAATFEYQSAQNYYRYGHWDEAKPRFEAVYNKYCKKDEVSLISWKTILNIAAEQNNLDERERLALLEQEKQCAMEGVKIEDDGIDLGSLLGDVAMQRAMDKFKECNANKAADVCTAAGDQLVSAVTKAPKHQSADAALHNAALAYENAQRFETAMQLYGRIVEEYPESDWVDKCLFKQAYAANKFFEYDTALNNYKILADEKRFKESEYREDAIYNSAFILTNLQDYQKAVPYWQRYASEVEDAKKSIEASYNSADMYFRAKRWNLAIKEYEKFIKRYERNSDAGPFVVKASYRTGLSHREMNKHKKETSSWKKTVELYARIVQDPGSMSAEFAAESHFLLIEEDMRQFEKFQIKGSQKQIDTKLKEGARKVKDFEDRYREVQDYRRPEWSLAAEFRIGYAFEVYAKAILNIPPPPLDKKLQKQLKKLPPEDREMVMIEYEDRFRDAMEQKVLPMEERAQEEYKIAVNLAKEGNISNEWTLLALDRMNAYDPENYPRQHNGLVELKRDTVAAPPFAAEVQ